MDLYRAGGPGGGDRAAVLGTQFLEGVLSHISALFSILELVLHLAVFGEVDSSDFLLKVSERRVHQFSFPKMASQYNVAVIV